MPTVLSKEINPPPESNNLFSSSSFSSSSNNNNNKQQHKIGKKSVGNQHKFAQQNLSKKFKASSDPEDNFGNSDIFIDAKVEQVVDKLSSCCANERNAFRIRLLTIFISSGQTSSTIYKRLP